MAKLHKPLAQLPFRHDCERSSQEVHLMTIRATRKRAFLHAFASAPSTAAASPEPAVPPRAWRATARLYFTITKPRIIPLLLITTLCAMCIASDHLPSRGLVLVTMLAGAFMAGGSHAINAYIDRDIDHLMQRTRSRPVVSGQIPATHALVLQRQLTRRCGRVVAEGRP